MKALTIWQPWAFAICHLGKRIENRDWSCHLEPGTPLAIHAGKAYDEDAETALLLRGYQGVPRKSEAIAGAVVAVALFDGEAGDIPAGHPQHEWIVPGACHWKLRDVVVLPTPIECRGYQKIWNLPPDVAEKVDYQWGKVEAEASE